MAAKTKKTKPKNKKTDTVVSVDIQSIASTVAKVAVRAAVSTSYKRHLEDTVRKHCHAQAKVFAKQYLLDNKDKINAEIKKLVIKKLQEEQKIAITKAVKAVKITVDPVYRRW